MWLNMVNNILHILINTVLSLVSLFGLIKKLGEPLLLEFGQYLLFIHHLELCDIPG